jgi:methionine-gamma-lyase
MSFPTSGVNTPIGRSITHRFSDARDIARVFAGNLPDGVHLYGRFGDPNYHDLCTCLTKMEGGESAIVFASGIAATDALFWDKLSVGDHLIVSSRIYGGTRGQIAMYADKLRLEVSVVDITDLHEVRAAVRRNTRLLFAETISNPDMVECDVTALAKICHAKSRNICLVIDNTFAPLIAKPLLCGADVVMHSLTKYVSGRSDGLAGALVGKKEFIDGLAHPTTGTASLKGAVLHAPYAQELADRFTCIEYRVREASERAFLIAKRFLHSGLDVRYPTVFPDVLKTRLNGMGELLGGGVFSVAFPSEEVAIAFTNRANSMMIEEPLIPDGTLAITAVSLGSSHTYMWCTTEARAQSKSAKWKALPFLPVPVGFVRIAVGYGGNREQCLAAFDRLLRELGY